MKRKVGIRFLGMLWFSAVLIHEVVAFSKQVILVTGASRGIGAVIATQLATNDSNIVYAGIRKDTKLEFTPTANLKPLLLDVTNETSVTAAVATILQEQGQIDGLINNAGVMAYGAHENMSLPEAQRIFDVNYFGVLRVTQAVLPSMREKMAGRILNIGSRSGFRPLPSLAVYADSKAAVLHSSQTLAATLTPWNIKVSVIEPGPVLTELDSISPYGTSLAEALDPYRAIFKQANLLAPEPGQALGPNAQASEEIALLVQQILMDPNPKLRYQTTRAIEAQAAQRAVDPTGNQDVAEIRSILYGG